MAILIGLLVTATPLWAQVGNAPNAKEGGFAQQAQEAVVTVKAEFTPPTAQQSGWLSITAYIKPTWHIYSTTQPPGGPLPTEIKLHPSKAFRLVGDFHATPPPQRKTEPAFDHLTVETHRDRVTWRVPIEIRSDLDLATLTITGVVRVQPCNPDTCLPPQEIAFNAIRARKATAPAEARLSLSSEGLGARKTAAIEPTNMKKTKQISLVVPSQADTTRGIAIAQGRARRQVVSRRNVM